MVKWSEEFSGASRRASAERSKFRGAADEVSVGVFRAKRPMTSLEEKVAGRRSRFSEKRKLPGVCDESARAAAVILVCPSRSLPNQPVQPTPGTGPVLNLVSPARRG